MAMSETPNMDALFDRSVSEIRPDRVVAIALGDGLPDGKSVSVDDFRRMVRYLGECLVARGGVLYAVTFGWGVGSDDDRVGVPEVSGVVLGGNVRDLVGLRADVRESLEAYGMSSAAFVVDAVHRPVFAG